MVGRFGDGGESPIIDYSPGRLSSTVMLERRMEDRLASVPTLLEDLHTGGASDSVCQICGHAAPDVNPLLLHLRSELSTTIGRDPTSLGSHWSRASECCLRQQSYAIRIASMHGKVLL